MYIVFFYSLSDCIKN